MRPKQTVSLTKFPPSRLAGAAATGRGGWAAASVLHFPICLQTVSKILEEMWFLCLKFCYSMAALVGQV